MADYKILIEFFTECVAHYKELLGFENEKLSLLIANNVVKLNEILTKEQAYIMRGEALEAKRIKLLKEQGLENQKFKELIDNAPDKYKGTLRDLNESLSKYVNEVKRVNTNAMERASQNLKSLNKRTTEPQTSTYDSSGGKNRTQDFGSLLSKNV